MDAFAVSRTANFCSYSSDPTDLVPKSLLAAKEYLLDIEARLAAEQASYSKPHQGDGFS